MKFHKYNLLNYNAPQGYRFCTKNDIALNDDLYWISKYCEKENYTEKSAAYRGVKYYENYPTKYRIGGESSGYIRKLND
jgi:hypothetical protein